MGPHRGGCSVALNRPNAIFTAAWVDRLSPSVDRSMDATVELYDPDTSGSVWDYETGTWAEGSATSLYFGKARVQPIRGTSSINNNANDTTVQSVLVSIPIGPGKVLDLRPQHRGRVLDAPLMPVLKNLVYIVQEVIDSQNAIERTFLMRVDQESRENG